tara:strand:- start:1072 stop:1218 length:147 start_codon:yes stop_codon:yes gene_type:complete
MNKVQEQIYRKRINTALRIAMKSKEGTWANEYWNRVAEQLKKNKYAKR